MTDKTWKIGILFCCDKCNMPMQITSESKFAEMICGLCGCLHVIATKEIIEELEKIAEFYRENGLDGVMEPKHD